MMKCNREGNSKIECRNSKQESKSNQQGTRKRKRGKRKTQGSEDEDPNHPPTDPLPLISPPLCFKRTKSPGRKHRGLDSR